MRKLFGIVLLSVVVYVVYDLLTRQKDSTEKLAKKVKGAIERIGGVLRVGEPVENPVKDPNILDEALWRLWCSRYYTVGGLLKPQYSTLESTTTGSKGDIEFLTSAYAPDLVNCDDIRKRLIDRGYKFE